MDKMTPLCSTLMTQRSRTKKLFFVLLCSMLLVSKTSFSITYYSIASGNWSAPTTWSLSPGGAPASVPPGGSDDAIITTGTVVNLTSSRAIGSVTINGTGTLNINTALTTLFVLVDFTMNNTSAITGSGTDRGINVSGNFFVSPTANATIGDVKLSVTGTFNIGTSATVTLNTGRTASKSFGHLNNSGTWNNTSHNVPIIINGNFQNNGTFTQGTGKVTFMGATSNTISGSATLTTFDSVVIEKSFFPPGSSSTSDQNIILDVQSVITIGAGKLFLRAGTFKVSSASTIVPFSATNYAISKAARLWNNGGTINSTADFADWYLAGTLQNSAGTITIGVAADHDLLTSAGVALSVDVGKVVISGGDVNVAGRIGNPGYIWKYEMSGGVLSVGTAVGGSFLSLFPTFFMDGTYSSFTMTGGRIIIVNANTSSLPANEGYYNIATLGGGFTGGTLQIGTAATPATTGKMRIETTRPIYNLEVVGDNTTALIASPASPTTTSLTITNNVTITSGILDIGTNNQDLVVGGNWTNTSAAPDPFIEGTKKVTFNGTSGTQTIASTGAGAINGTNFYDLTFNNTSPSVPQINMTANVLVKNKLTMTAGKVNLNSNTLTLGTNALLPGTLDYTQGWLYGTGSFTRWMDTPIRVISDARGLFPMGSSTDYHPLWFGNNVALSSGGTLSVTHTPASNGSVAITPYTDATWTPGTHSIVGISIAAWTIIPANSFAINPLNNASLRYGGTGFNPFVSSEINASLIASAVGTWSANTGVTPTYFEVNRTNLSTVDLANTWYIGTTNLTTSPLPIELLSFDAYMLDTSVNVKWSTATETNCDYFLIERLTDGYDWKAIAQMNGHGTTTSLHDYNTLDPTAPFGYNYYRLKQVDYNGESEIFPIKSIYKPFRNKEVSKYINALGQQIADVNNYKGLYFILYTDGVIEKRVQN